MSAAKYAVLSSLGLPALTKFADQGRTPFLQNADKSSIRAAIEHADDGMAELGCQPEGAQKKDYRVVFAATIQLASK